MKVNKLINGLLIFLILLICVGTVSADDINQVENTLDTVNDDVFTADEVLTDSQSNSGTGNSEDLLSEDLTGENSKGNLGEEEPSSFKEIQDDINSGKNVINLTKNYKFNSDTDNKEGISFYNKYVTINANGHTLDGDNLARIFKLSGTATLVLNDAKIINGFSDQNGGAIYATYKLTLNNVTFINNNAKNDLIPRDGGAIYLAPSSAASSMTLKNCTFANNSAAGCGGAVATDYNSGIGRYILTISDSLFENNTADSGHGLGGAVYATGVAIDNATFLGNKAGYNTGSGGAVSSPLIKSFNSKFINNTAVAGGALSNSIASSFATTNFNVVNSTFESNKADLAGGAIKISGSDSIGNVLIENSSFTNNDGGRYGGGAIISPLANVTNSNFTNNSAFNYGGAISSQKLDAANCKFENNNAKHSGAIFAIDFSIEDSQFEGNEARDGSIITTLSDFNHEDTDLPEVKTFDDAYNSYWSTYWWDLEGILHCTEHELDNTNVDSFYTSDMSYVINYVDKSEIIEHVKILYYLCNLDEDMLYGGFRNYNGQYELSAAIYHLCSEDLSEPNNETVKKVMDLYNSGFRVPDDHYLLPNGTMVNYKFHLFINPQYAQNYLRYEQSLEDGYNESVFKETLNKTVEIGQEVQFRITVTNNGIQTLKGVFVNDSDFDEGLVYQSYLNETGEWIFNESSKIWSLTTDLEKGDSASFIIIFKTTKVGELVNNVTAGFDNFVLADSSNTTEVTEEKTRKVNDDPTEDNPSEDNPADEGPTANDNPTNDANATDTGNAITNNAENATDESNTPNEDTLKEDNLYKGAINKAAISKTATGNPLFALVLMVVTLIFVPKRKN